MDKLEDNDLKRVHDFLRDLRAIPRFTDHPDNENLCWWMFLREKTNVLDEFESVLHFEVLESVRKQFLQ